jgi:hypothetical protein
MIPIDDTYETCVRAVAMLRVYRVDPDEVTCRLGLTPTYSGRKGEVKMNDSGRTRTMPQDVWLLSSEGAVQSKDIRRHLDWLLAKLLPVKDALLELQGVPGVAMNVECIWWSTGDGGPVLWPEQMRGLSELNLECGFELSFWDEESGS